MTIINGEMFIIAAASAERNMNVVNLSKTENSHNSSTVNKINTQTAISKTSKMFCIIG